MYPSWTETTKRIVAVLGVVLGLLLLYLARGTLKSLLLAGVVAYALYPIVGWLHHRLRFPHALATVFVYVLLLLLVAAIPVLLVPVIAGQIQSIEANLATLFADSREWLRTTLRAWRTVQVLGGTLDLSSLVDPALSALGESGGGPVIPPPETWLPNLFGTLSGFAFTVTSATAAFFLTLLYSFYLVKDSPEWGKRMDELVPEIYRGEWEEVQRRLNEIWGSFFRGQLLFSLTMALLTFALLAILGISGSVPLALLVGVLEIIPNIGPIIALVPIALVTLIGGASTLPTTNGWDLLIVVAVYILLQVLGANFLAPVIIGKSVNLPPLFMLIGVVIGASIAGLIGAFLATPVLATLRVVTTYAYNKILDRPPFPEETPSGRRRELPPAPVETPTPEPADGNSPEPPSPGGADEV